MKLLTYSVWSRYEQCVVDCNKEEIYIRSDGKIGYIDTTGRFIEDDDLVINSLEIK